MYVVFVRYSVYHTYHGAMVLCMLAS